MQQKRALCILAICLTVAACGQTGPLYLSDQDKATRAALIKQGKLPDTVNNLKPKAKKNEAGIIDTQVV